MSVNTFIGKHVFKALVCELSSVHVLWTKFNNVSPRGRRDDADGSSTVAYRSSPVQNRGGSKSVRGRVRSPLIWSPAVAKLLQAASVPTVQAAATWDRDGRTDGRIALGRGYNKPLFTLPAYYAEPSVCNGRASVCPPFSLSRRSTAAMAAGGHIGALRAGYIDRLLRAPCCWRRRSAANGGSITLRPDGGGSTEIVKVESAAVSFTDDAYDCCRPEYNMLDPSKRHPRIWWHSSKLHESGRMSKRLRRYARELRCYWLGTEQRRAVLLDSDVSWNWKFYNNWCHYSLCTESAKPKWVCFTRLHLLSFELFFVMNEWKSYNNVRSKTDC